MKKVCSLLLCLAMLLLMLGCQREEAQISSAETTVPVTEATEAPTSAPTTAPTTVPTEPPRPWAENVLMADHIEYPDPLYVLGNTNLDRQDIESVTFLDTLADMPEDAWDVSEAQNGSVMAWVTKGNDLYIAGEGGVMAPADCSNLFYYYGASSINFNGNFHTENVENMSAMFWFSMVEELDLTGMDLSNVRRMDYCFADSVLTNVSMPGLELPKLERVNDLFHDSFKLETLDLSNWSTPSLTNMSQMFFQCKALREVNLSGWDTSNVTDMSSVFSACEKLENIDMSGWDTSNVTDMGYMFYACYCLTELDLSHFDTSNVTNMQEMFHDAMVKTLDLTNFDTSKVTVMDGMLLCWKAETIELGEWETDSVESYKDFMPRNFKPDGKDWKELFD